MNLFLKMRILNVILLLRFQILRKPIHMQILGRTVIYVRRSLMMPESTPTCVMSALGGSTLLVMQLCAEIYQEY